MDTIKDYFIQAELALAAYADLQPVKGVKSHFGLTFSAMTCYTWSDESTVTNRIRWGLVSRDESRQAG
jgi:hypothetical protein